MGGSFASRLLGVVLLVATVGLASCQALIAAAPEAPAIASDPADED